MKLTIEPTRFQNMLKSVLIAKSKTDSIFPNINAEFTSKGVAIKEMQNNCFIIAANFNKDYFVDYECKTPEKIVLTSQMLNALGWGFDDVNIQVKTDEEYIYFEGAKNQYKEKLIAVDGVEVKTKMTTLDKEIYPATADKGVFPMTWVEYNTKDKDGKTVRVVPSPDRAMVVLAEVAAKELSGIPEDKSLTGNIVLSGDGKDLSIILKPKEGNSFGWQSKLKLNQKEKVGECEIILDKKFFVYSVANQPETFWLGYNDGGMVMVGKTKDSTITYMLTAIASSTESEEESTE